MAHKWHLIRPGKAVELVTSSQLRELAAAGKLTLDDLVRREDMKVPVKARSLKGLFAEKETSREATLVASPLPNGPTTSPTRALRWNRLIAFGVVGFTFLAI